MENQLPSAMKKMLGKSGHVEAQETHGTRSSKLAKTKKRGNSMTVGDFEAQGDRRPPKKTRDGKVRKFGDVIQQDSSRAPVSNCVVPMEQADYKATFDGEWDYEASSLLKKEGTSDGVSKKHFTRSRGKKCEACYMCDHWTENCPIFKKLTVKIGKLKPQCLICGEGCGHWSDECPHGPIKKPVQRMNLENVVGVVYLPREDGDEDLYELFREFNPTRCCIYPEYKSGTGELTGFGSGAGQVSFQTDEDAQKAIEKFNGYVYKGQTLNVQWITVKGTPRLGG